MKDDSKLCCEREERARVGQCSEVKTLRSSLLLLLLVPQDNHESLSQFLKQTMCDRGSDWNWEHRITGKIRYANQRVLQVRLNIA